MATQDIDICCDFSEENLLRLQSALDGRSCSILRLDALIRSKQAMGRPKDLETIKQLEAIQRERL
ncbi:hypothetical protein PDESU_00247 [Pontiella desulfatans]|uniref:Uncharacterized protein n=1 Tax=Pontiella desulfatans TaxID=2750659 RepID=A0A6C2TWK1_PONDE|nr:hypothetical protein PDESU_00247 [Pontiella desulfatans]